MNKSFWQVCIFLSLFLVLFSFHPINLSTADIGRHIENGKIFLHSAEFGISKSSLLHTNLFSYTFPDFSFINHHWGSGIVVYIIYSALGFSGLSIVYFLLILGSLLLAILTIRHEASLKNILLVAIFLVPLVASRSEVRPEALSYFFLVLFTYILYKYSHSINLGAKLPSKLLWLLPILELIWANTHIYFIFGIFLIGMFLFETLILKQVEKFKKLLPILLTSIVATCITPYGITGAIYPFTIFKNYGYKIVENQSISFLEHLSFINPEFLWYKIAIVLLTISSAFILIKIRQKFLWALSGATFTFATLAYLGIRHIPAFALFVLPLLAYNFTIITNTLREKFKEKINSVNENDRKIFYGFCVAVLIGVTMLNFRNKLAWNRSFSLGIDKTEFTSIDFIKTNEVHGPFFNNYDIGGFMIFGLFKQEKVFVDNRPEAYPKEFFNDVYIPMQQDDSVWQKKLKEFKFNAIFFYRLDYTPWGPRISSSLG